MISAETRYETYDGELLAFVETFKTWRHYLEGCKHEVLVLTNPNNLQRFIGIKSLSSRQVWWDQKLSKYHFWIDYQQDKTNRPADILFRYLQQSVEEDKTLRAENTKILHRLQSLLARVLGLNVSGISVLGLEEVSSLLHQVFICETAVLPQLRQFSDTIWSKLAHESSYTASIGGMRMRLPEL